MAFFDRIGYRGLEGCGLLFWRESSLPSSTPAPQSPFFVLATDRVGIERLTGASLVRGAQTYANPATRPTLRQAASVLPEALGQGVGTVAGAEATSAGLSAAKNL